MTKNQYSSINTEIRFDDNNTHDESDCNYKNINSNFEIQMKNIKTNIKN